MFTYCKLGRSFESAYDRVFGHVLFCVSHCKGELSDGVGGQDSYMLQRAQEATLS